MANRGPRDPYGLDTFVCEDNTPERRWATVNVPPRMREWSFETIDAGLTLHRIWLEAWLEAWMTSGTGPRLVVLWGPPGTGKTGLLVSTLRRAAECGAGSLAIWNRVTASGLWEAIDQGRVTSRPAPVWFERWSRVRDRTLPFRREQTGPSLLEDFAERTALLGIDDADVDGLSPWKESILLSLLDGEQRVMLTTNADAVQGGLASAFGERCADRMLDERMTKLMHCSRATSLRMGA